VDLGDRTAIVIGGAGGIGAAIVEHLRAAGATVHVWDLATGVDITDRSSVEAAAPSPATSTCS